ncbi:hypothetical protein ACTWPT_22585 [Nonomuraea sp. 3N208]
MAAQQPGSEGDVRLYGVQPVAGPPDEPLLDQVINGYGNRLGGAPQAL